MVRWSRNGSIKITTSAAASHDPSAGPLAAMMRYRKLARQIATDPDTARRIKELIADLERELREFDK